MQHWWDIALWVSALVGMPFIVARIQLDAIRPAKPKYYTFVVTLSDGRVLQLWVWSSWPSSAAR